MAILGRTHERGVARLARRVHKQPIDSEKRPHDLCVSILDRTHERGVTRGARVHKQPIDGQKRAYDLVMTILSSADQRRPASVIRGVAVDVLVGKQRR